MATSTKHGVDCKRVFARYDMDCARCVELASGSKARSGWQAGYFARKAERAQMDEAAIAAHFAADGVHARGTCGPVCTFGDW